MSDDELWAAAGDVLADMMRPGGDPQWTYRGRKTWDVIADVLAAFVAERPADGDIELRAEAVRQARRMRAGEGRAVPAEDGLTGLLAAVESLFGPSRSAFYQFHVGRITGVWEFKVVDSWAQWLKRDLQYEFTAPTAAGAVAKFLDYVRVHGIDVRSLTEGG